MITRIDGVLINPGHHDDPQAFRVQAFDRVRGRFLDRIGDADQPGQGAVDQAVHDRAAVAAVGIRSLVGFSGIDSEPSTKPGGRPPLPARQSGPGRPCR